MLEAADESLDFPGSDLAFGEVQRHGPPEGGLCAREPHEEGRVDRTSRDQSGSRTHAPPARRGASIAGIDRSVPAQARSGP